MLEPPHFIFFPRQTDAGAVLTNMMKPFQCLSVLKICCSIGHLYQLHAQIIVSGLCQDIFLRELVKLASLSSFKSLSYARSILKRSESSTPVLWNMLIRGYATSSSSKEAMLLLQRMRERGIRRNKLTYPFVLKACAMISALLEGRQVHAEILKHGLEDDLYVCNNLVNFYGCCKKINDARRVFDQMPVRSVVSWNAVITACVESLWFDDGIGYFSRMRDCGFEPDETTMVIVLSACAELGNLSLGRWVHSHILNKGLILNCQLGTTLVDMYAKCGDVSYAKVLFNTLEEKNVWTWSAMILGLAQHGSAEEALELYDKMVRTSQVCPNHVTFLGVIFACSHVGRVEDGYMYFHQMEHVYGFKPAMVHYGAMVDLLGRAGRLEEAYAFMMNMPIDPDPILLRTLLSACSIHDAKQSCEVEEKVRKRLLQLEPKRSGNLVMVANRFALAGLWDSAVNLRRAMRGRGLKKIAGESCLELDGSIQKFFSGYNSKLDSDGVYKLLDELNLHLRSC